MRPVVDEELLAPAPVLAEDAGTDQRREVLRRGLVPGEAGGHEVANAATGLKKHELQERALQTAGPLPRTWSDDASSRRIVFTSIA